MDVIRIENLIRHESRFCIYKNKHEIFSILPAGDSPQEWTASHNLAYYLGREIINCSNEIHGGLKGLEKP